MKSRKNGKTQKVAAAQSGFSERSARNIEQRGFAEASHSHSWKTRKDPFEPVWKSEVVFLLEQNPHLQTRTILEELQKRHPD